MTSILIVDDDDMIRGHLARILRQAGFTAFAVADGQEALAAIERNPPDLIVLDVLMPRTDGRQVLATLRRRGDWTPVILLTGIGEARTRADALDKGADDYLNKPFDPAELIARIKAVLRRGRGGQSLVHAHVLTGGGLRVDRLAKTTTLNRKPLSLTPKAQALLEFLMVNHGETYSRDDLLNQVWGIEFAITTRAVDHRIAEIRKALAIRGVEDLIDTVQGVGYRFHPKVEAE